VAYFGAQDIEHDLGDLCGAKALHLRNKHTRMSGEYMSERA